MDNSGWREKIDRFKLPIGMSLVGIVLIVGGMFASGLSKSKPKDLPVGRQDFPKESLIDSQKRICRNSQ